MAVRTGYVTDEAELLAKLNDKYDKQQEQLDAIGDRQDAQTELLGKLLETTREMRGILQGLADAVTGRQGL